MSAAKRGYGRSWERIRAAYIALHPVCEHPECNRPSREVDHVDGRGPYGDNTDANLSALCKPHHSAKTAKSAAGFGRTAV